MSADLTTFIQTNDSFILTVLGIISAAFTACLGFMLKSRCRVIKCCGLECQREVLSVTEMQSIETELNNTA